MSKHSGPRAWTPQLRALATTGASREVRDLLGALQKEGVWEGRLTSKGHVLIRRQDTTQVVTCVASTPSSPKSLPNAVGDLRRAGAVLR